MFAFRWRERVTYVSLSREITGEESSKNEVCLGVSMETRPGAKTVSLEMLLSRSDLVWNKHVSIFLIVCEGFMCSKTILSVNLYVWENMHDSCFNFNDMISAYLSSQRSKNEEVLCMNSFLNLAKTQVAFSGRPLLTPGESSKLLGENNLALKSVDFLLAWRARRSGVPLLFTFFYQNILNIECMNWYDNSYDTRCVQTGGVVDKNLCIDLFATLRWDRTKTVAMEMKASEKFSFLYELDICSCDHGGRRREQPLRG